MALPHEGFHDGPEHVGFIDVDKMQPNVQLDSSEQDVYAAELEEWRREWGETLEVAKGWGPVVANAYRDAREAAGGTMRQQYDGEGDPIPFTGPEEIARNLQPDVLVVDLTLRNRSWRHPLPGDVNEKVFAACWTILRREYPAGDAPEAIGQADEDEDAPSAKPQHDNLLDELEDIDPETGDVPGDPSHTNGSKMMVERVVVTHDGRIIRFVGTSDERDHPDAPLRFARIRPDKKLKEDAPDKYAKQEEVLTEYMEDNASHFVPSEKMKAAAILDPTTIESAKLNQLPDDAPADAEDYELQAWMLREGLAEFLEHCQLASPEYIAALRS
ncbi:MAG TPA: hypothetical protein VFT16_01320 [Candidatus Saccharimonadales bacterium]|nr:hypothetical protein [Candidatus Saccharimonadales bacterium]